MTRVVVMILRPRPGAPVYERCRATVWYGNGQLRSESVLDDIIALPGGMPLTGTALEAALEHLCYGDSPVTLEEPRQYPGQEPTTPLTFSQACDWMFDECDQFVVVRVNASDEIESVHKLDRYWPFVGPDR